MGLTGKSSEEKSEPKERNATWCQSTARVRLWSRRGTPSHRNADGFDFDLSLHALSEFLDWVFGSPSVGDADSLFFFFGYLGESAFGPPTFMHRGSIMERAEAVVTHHSRLNAL